MRAIFKAISIGTLANRQIIKLKKMKFNEKINHILKKSGWKANRRVSVEAYLGVWEKYRFPIFKKAITFVESFGEIILKDSFYSDFHKTDIFITAKFFPFEATENIAETGWIEEVYPPLAKENLLPVGTLNEYTTIMIGESGKFYGGYDDFFAILGENETEMLQNIFNGYRFEVIRES